jgi:ribulose-phosphate 3-epimerase
MERYSKFTKRVQIDITDGEFSRNKTLGLDSIFWPKGMKVDLHMMVASPLDYVDKIIEMKPNLAIFHVEAEDLMPTYMSLKGSGVKFGVAFLRETYPGNYAQILGHADHALIFSGNLGEYGGAADPLMLGKVGILRRANPGIEIGWDGGANLENVLDMANAGVNVINVGNYIAGSENPEERFRMLECEISQKGSLKI